MRFRGYSFVELILVIAIMSMIAVIAVPRLQFGAVDRKAAESTVQRLAASLRRTRSLALRDAVSAPRGYILTLEDDGPRRGYAIKNAETGIVVDRHRLADGVRVAGLDGTSFWFGPYGNLQQGSASQVHIMHGNWGQRISVTSATGMVTITPEARP